MSSNSPPPVYSDEAADGEATLTDATIVATAPPLEIDEDEEKHSMEPPSYPVAPLRTRKAGPTMPPPPTPQPYRTPLATPFSTAPNTPMPYGMSLPPQAHEMVNYQPQQHFNYGPSPPPMAPSHPSHFPMQPMYMQQPLVMTSPQQPAPINVVVNTNTNTSTFPSSSDQPALCPHCRKGVIRRAQHKKKRTKICLFSLLTCFCLFCLPCLCLHCNYVDQCTNCKVIFGHKGTKKQKRNKNKK